MGWGGLFRGGEGGLCTAGDYLWGEGAIHGDRTHGHLPRGTIHEFLFQFNTIKRMYSVCLKCRILAPFSVEPFRLQGHI